MSLIGNEDDFETFIKFFSQLIIDCQAHARMHGFTHAGKMNLDTAAETKTQAWDSTFWI